MTADCGNAQFVRSGPCRQTKTDASYADTIFPVSPEYPPTRHAECTRLWVQNQNLTKKMTARMKGNERMMTIGHLTDIQELHHAAVAQNTDEIALATAADDDAALRRAYDSAAFLDIVADWIEEAESMGRPA